MSMRPSFLASVLIGEKNKKVPGPGCNSRVLAGRKAAVAPAASLTQKTSHGPGFSIACDTVAKKRAAGAPSTMR